MLSEKKNLFF